ncbi:hypothetical protein MBLNU230_g6535t1 [Neophaeotheca triangularis]
MHISSCELHVVNGRPKIYINNPTPDVLRAMADFATPMQRQGWWETELTNIDKGSTPKPNYNPIYDQHFERHTNAPRRSNDNSIIGLGIDLGERFQSPTPRLSQQPKRPDDAYIHASFLNDDPAYASYIPQPYRNVLLNRPQGYNLDPGGKWDVEVFKPVFVFDSLMLPGTVATTINKVSQEQAPPPPKIKLQFYNLYPPPIQTHPPTDTPTQTDPLRLYPRLAPALLRAHTLLPAKNTHQPLLLPTPTTPSSYARGCLLYGLDKQARSRIYSHQLALVPKNCKGARITVEVQTDVVVCVHEPGSVPSTRWRLRTVFVQAGVVVCDARGCFEGSSGVERGKGEWSLGRFLAGGFEGEGRSGGGAGKGVAVDGEGGSGSGSGDARPGVVEESVVTASGWGLGQQREAAVQPEEVWVAADERKHDEGGGAGFAGW